MDADKIRTNLEIQRFLRDESWPAFSEYARTDSAGEVAAQISARVRLLVDFEIHRRKIFWVDESLVYILVKTDLDVTGAEVRAPFPTFALVFTDRLTLSLAKRMLSMDKVSPLAGYLLRVATVYHSEDRGVVLVAFALDALGTDPPHLSIHEIPLVYNRAISHALDELAPKAQTGTLTLQALERVGPAGSCSIGLWFVTTGAVPHRDGQTNACARSIRTGKDQTWRLSSIASIAPSA